MSAAAAEEPKKEEETAPVEEETTQEEAAPAEEEKPKKKRAKKEKKMSAAQKKRLSTLARKKEDPRYYLNDKGRYVSRKKSENGKKNVQSRAIRLARKGLDVKGMVLVGKGDVGSKLLKATNAVRQMLKDGKKDDEAEAMLAALIKEDKL